ncbi:FHA domain-containing protein [Desertihabitans aurantiacus]|uniref:FHA domain-containing protein n=1 Tax=Desertihabitans aurantiacus TaxID=2282477 RepID=UPI0038B82E52
MRISFEHQPPVLLDAPGGVVLGRAPQTRDGRTPVPVVGPRGLVSRTHALVDVEERGRITVTDVGSRNGTGPVGSRTPFRAASRRRWPPGPGSGWPTSSARSSSPDAVSGRRSQAGPMPLHAPSGRATTPPAPARTRMRPGDAVATVGRVRPRLDSQPPPREEHRCAD